ncbi:uncharacterized protein BDR25DRAFT_351347 [Lindgomyces ingoldianus]|uniref:Uncharacterized protein n=1 Tax=Lindgomyces ingoldianus TaxID=673940 RepID=A0ACB6R940_9PLEO|nr:uncharacterized protein BDR25DRAFT_351347 [Lindgomyces ingoldianus]KAF2474845.1 hypothetical protein BDR25DRAFT_351347 [Lindgomyces ingoldianus]
MLRNYTNSEIWPRPAGPGLSFIYGIERTCRGKPSVFMFDRSTGKVEPERFNTHGTPGYPAKLGSGESGIVLKLWQHCWPDGLAMRSCENWHESRCNYWRQKENHGKPRPSRSKAMGCHRTPSPNQISEKSKYELLNRAWNSLNYKEFQENKLKYINFFSGNPISKVL